MDIFKIDKAEEEAVKFIEKIALLRKEHEIRGDGIFYGCKETASIKRQSMELTRSLADLRKSS